jgi:hypothetical protein
MTQQLTTEILSAALETLTSKRQQIDDQIAIRKMLGGRANGAKTTTDGASRKHHISAAGRRAIAAAQRRRWAEQEASGSTAKAKKPKRRLSPEGRRAIVVSAEEAVGCEARRGSNVTEKGLKEGQGQSCGRRCRR